MTRKPVSAITTPSPDAGTASLTLKALIESADAASANLSAMLAAAKGDDHKAEQSSLHLQERLRLSARMLKAFQAQIARVEAAMASLDECRSRADAAMRAMDERIAQVNTTVQEGLLRLEVAQRNQTQAIERAFAERQELARAAMETAVNETQQRLEETVRSSTGLLEQGLKSLEAQSDEAMRQIRSTLEQASARAVQQVEQHIAARQEEISRINQHVTEALPRANAILAIVENAQSRISALAQQVDEAAMQTQVARQETVKVIGQCEEARTGLISSVSESASQIQIAATRAQELRSSVQEVMAAAEATDTGLRKRLNDVRAAVTSLEKAEGMAQRLASLANHLAPWERVVLRQTGDGSPTMPEPLAQLIDEAKRQVRVEMSRLGASMRAVAAQLEGHAESASPWTAAATGMGQSSATPQRRRTDPARSIIEDLTAPGAPDRAPDITEVITNAVRDGVFRPS